MFNFNGLLLFIAKFNQIKLTQIHFRYGQKGLTKESRSLGYYHIVI